MTSCGCPGTRHAAEGSSAPHTDCCASPYPPQSRSPPASAGGRQTRPATRSSRTPCPSPRLSRRVGARRSSLRWEGCLDQMGWEASSMGGMMDWEASSNPSPSSLLGSFAPPRKGGTLRSSKARKWEHPGIRRRPKLSLFRVSDHAFTGNDVGLSETSG